MYISWTAFSGDGCVEKVVSPTWMHYEVEDLAVAIVKRGVQLTDRLPKVN
jgi:hypothetical protein